ncbi:DegT/DnrJ/EryC1/StrS family aminotransferase [Candidatus Omnitrophota bacterium]
MKVPFVDLAAQYRQIKSEAILGIDKLCRQGNFILGEELVNLEQEFADYCGVKFAVGLNSGTDALFLALRSLDIGKGDEVIVPAFTFIATALAVSHTQATPVFVDVDKDTYNIDAERIKKAITRKTRAIIPVHIFGQPADMRAIMKIADRHGLKVIEDAAQAHGAGYKSTRSGLRGKTQRVGSLGDIGCFSFYPTKNLGALGDAGMAVTSDLKVYRKLRILRDCGRSSHNTHIIKGYNSRLDTLQAIALRLKLKYLERWNGLRRRNAKIYTGLFRGNPDVLCPYEAAYARHVYHVYALQVKERDRLFSHLRRKGIGVLIHYPCPVHLQKAYKDAGYKRGDCPVSEKITRRIISLPMHPALSRRQIQYVAGEVLSFLD